MQLRYLLFDATDEESGACGFDALASVQPDRVPALLREIEAVLGWAVGAFGVPSHDDDDAPWNVELQAVDDDEAPLDIRCDFDPCRVTLPPARGRVTIAVTLGGSAAFANAFREAFPAED